MSDNTNVGRQLGLRVSEKGAIMVTGLRKFPVTFYADEWEALSSLITNGHIRKFAAAHKAQLKQKVAGAPKEGTELVTV